MESDIQFCERVLVGLVGPEHAQLWWNSPNKAFEGRTPSVQWLYDKDVVVAYLSQHASGDYS